MSTEQRNLFLAIALSLVILLGFQFFIEQPRRVEQQARAPQSSQTEQTEQQQQQRPDVAAPTAPAAPGGAPPAQAGPPREQALAAVPRVAIDTPRLKGSISLAGGRIDDLVLKDYKQTTKPDSPSIVLLEPQGSERPYFAEFGLTPASAGIATPPPDAVWRADRERLGAGETVTLTWDNGQGLRFVRQISVDRDFLFTITQRIENATAEPVTLHPYGLISRTGTPPTEGFYILHEGLLGVLDGTLREHDYKDLQEAGRIEERTEGGWLGITDKYWLTTLIPNQEQPVTARFVHELVDGQTDRYQTDFLGEPITAPPGGSAEATAHFFAGAKEVTLLDRYGEELGMPNFDKAVDFGWFYWITKPLFYVLHALYGWLGNLGLAILLLTVCVKLIFFPLANKSYRAMSQMKKLSPEMTRLREKYGDDRQRLNQELMALYKREKVNPAAGCLPIVIQIPVFFALYKVLYVAIEMRHAPFFGWIRDLSAPDPTTVFNLFGLIPWDPPSFLHIGAWPLLMGFTMWLQQRLNPQPADPVQAKVFMLMPIFFTFLLAPFAAGLVIYWTWNNILSIVQQWVIMKRMGVKNPAA